MIWSSLCQEHVDFVILDPDLKTGIPTLASPVTLASLMSLMHEVVEFETGFNLPNSSIEVRPMCYLDCNVAEAFILTPSDS